MAFLEGFYQTKKFETMKEYSDRINTVEFSSAEFFAIENECDTVGINIFIVSHQEIVFSSTSAISKESVALVNKAIVELFKNSEEQFSMGMETLDDARGNFYYATQKDGDIILTDHVQHPRTGEAGDSCKRCITQAENRQNIMRRITQHIFPCG